MILTKPDIELERIREIYKDKKITFCSGVFDITHAGHALFFEDCKKYGDILVVAVGDDRITRDLKGNNRPIINQYMRAKMVDSLKPVDYCFIDSYSSAQEPLRFMEIVFKKLKPDVFLINGDAFNIAYRKEICQRHSVRLEILKRSCPKEFEDISTTKIIEKIKNN